MRDYQHGQRNFSLLKKKKIKLQANSLEKTPILGKEKRETEAKMAG